MSIASDPKHCPKCQTPLPGDAPQGLCPKCLLAAAALPTEAGQPAPDKTPPSVAELAAAFPQLEILELIGQGGMGFVFKARQPKLDRFVALKILPQSLAADPAFAERFSREGRVLAKLNHPNIVTIHDFGIATGRADLPVRQDNEAAQQHRTTPQFYYLLMEFVDGVNLRQAMRAGRFTPDQALAIVPKICEALQFAHNEGILHRDIKPENILLDAKGRVKIADFGIAKLVGTVAQTFQSAGSGGVLAASSEEGNTGLGSPVNPQAGKPALPPEALTEAGKALGTPNYMAPEQRECSGEVDQRADIYSLGVVFYEMLTGELPLGRFAPPSQKSAADPRVDEVVLRALEKEKAKRYASADEVRTQVETIAATPPPVNESSQSQNQESSGKRSRIFVAGFILAACFNFIAAVIWGEVAESKAWPTYATLPFVLHLLAGIGFGVAGYRRYSHYGRRREEAQTEKMESGKRNAEIVPRFSRTAIVGACLGLAFPVFAVGLVLIHWKLSFALLLVFLGFIATTILGWVAVSQIRRSAGKLHGLWLAVFDGLLFPLLALDVVIFSMGWFAGGQLTPDAFGDTVAAGYKTGLFVAVWVSGATLLSGIADYFIIRRVWRAVNKGGAGAPTNGTPKPSKSNGWEYTPGESSPLTSPEVREISAHMTDAEKSAMKKFGGWFGIWNSATFFLPMACLFFIPIPVPLNWIIAATVLLVGLAGYPYWWRKMANHLCDTTWAKARGCNPATLRIFPFGSTGIMLLGVVWLAVVSLCWWQTYRPDGVWLPWLSQASIKEAAGGTSIRVTEVSRHGQTVLVRIICDQIPHGGELAPVFAGPLIELPYVLPAAVTNVDCLLMPAPHTYVGNTIAGTNVLSGKSSFLLGFMLPDEQAAAAAVKQVQKLNLGKRHGVDSPLFVLRRTLGKDAKGKAIYEDIICWIGMQAKAVTRKPKAAAPQLSFGPVMERVVNSGASSHGNEMYLDLDTGHLMDYPQDKIDRTVPQAMQRWLARNGLDLHAANQAEAWPEAVAKVQDKIFFEMSGQHLPAGPLRGVFLCDSASVPLDNAQWNAASPDSLAVALRLVPASAGRFYSAGGELPVTLGFKTRDGGMGLLQITGFTENPRGVKLRYKLVQSEKK